MRKLRSKKKREMINLSYKWKNCLQPWSSEHKSAKKGDYTKLNTKAFIWGLRIAIQGTHIWAATQNCAFRLPENKNQGFLKTRECLYMFFTQKNLIGVGRKPILEESIWLLRLSLSIVSTIASCRCLGLIFEILAVWPSSKVQGFTEWGYA